MLAFHSVPEEYQAATEGAALFEPTGRELLRITGSERVSFLHGMVTSDVHRLAEGAIAPAAVLTPKGALVADARVWRRAEDVLLETGPGLGSTVREHLSRYLISEDAELLDGSAELASVSVLGPRSAEAIAAALGSPVLCAPGRFSSVGLAGALVLMAEPWLTGRPGLDLWVPRSALGELLAKLEPAGESPRALRCGPETYEVLRVESGVPRYGVELDEGTLVLEAGLERAVSYQKGCYVGQEVVARATFRGQVQRKLTGLLLGDEAPAAGASLFRGEKKVGQLRSIARSRALGQTIALGYVHRDSLAAGTRLDLEGRPGAVTVQPLPFVALV